MYAAFRDGGLKGFASVEAALFGDFLRVGFRLGNLVQGVLRQSGCQFRVVCFIFHKYRTIPFRSVACESASQALWLQGE